MVLQTQDDQIPLGETPYLDHYLEDFQNSYYRKSKAEVAAISILTKAAWPKVWKPDAAGAALAEWRRNTESLGYPRAHEIHQQRLAAAPQTRDVPRTIVRRITQLRPELYPVQSALVCHLYFEGSWDLPGTFQPERPGNQDLFYARSYLRGREWLQTLPVGIDEPIYFAQRPQETLVLAWGEFLTYWDAFYPERFCYAHACDDTNDWFLFLHGEQILIFGCTKEHAAKFATTQMERIPLPICYREALMAQHDASDRFRRSLRKLPLTNRPLYRQRRSRRRRRG